MFRVEFEADDVNGILLPIDPDTVTLSVKPGGEESWTEVAGVVTLKLNLESVPAHPADNQFSVKLVNLKDYLKVDSHNVVTEKLIRKS
jgi:hypothetical protein